MGGVLRRRRLAEFVVLALLVFVKRLRELAALQNRAEWSSDFAVSELRGKTIGLIGLGNAGLTTARLLRRSASGCLACVVVWKNRQRSTRCTRARSCHDFSNNSTRSSSPLP